MRVILRTNVAAILKNIDGQDSIFGSLILVKVHASTTVAFEEDFSGKFCVRT